VRLAIRRVQNIFRALPSICVAAAQDGGEGTEQYSKVQACGGAPDQHEVEALSPRIAEAAATSDLPQACHPRPYRQDFAGGESVVVPEFLDRNGTRSDERHLTCDNVIELRKFVE